MTDNPETSGDLGKEELEFDERNLRQIRERVLEAEKEKLHMDIPRGVINDIEDIIREEIN